MQFLFLTFFLFFGATGVMAAGETVIRDLDSTYGMREAYARILWQDKVPDPHGNRMFCFTCHPGVNHLIALPSSMVKRSEHARKFHELPRKTD